MSDVLYTEQREFLKAEVIKNDAGFFVVTYTDLETGYRLPIQTLCNSLEVAKSRIKKDMH